MAWAPSIPFSVKFWYHYWYKKYTTMESWQQLKWRWVLREKVHLIRTKDERQTDRCYYLVIYSHLELDHARDTYVCSVIEYKYLSVESRNRIK
jgi:hypothetical protein